METDGATIEVTRTYLQMTSPGAEAPKAAETPPPQEPTTARSREAFRSRDREQR